MLEITQTMLEDALAYGRAFTSQGKTAQYMLYPPKGDAFAARNKYAMQIDFEEQPPMFKITDTHYAATWLLHPNAPKIDPPKSITDRIARMEAKRGGKVNGEE